MTDLKPCPFCKRPVEISSYESWDMTPGRMIYHQCFYVNHGYPDFRSEASDEYYEYCDRFPFGEDDTVRVRIIMPCKDMTEQEADEKLAILWNTRIIDERGE